MTDETGLGAPDAPKRGRLSWIPSRVLTVLAASVPLGLVVALGVGMASGVGDEPLGDVDSGFSVATDFTLPKLEGGTFTLGEHADGPVFLYFWASWCVPCRVEAPLIQTLWPEYEQRGYTFVGVNIIDSESAARSFVEEFELSFPILIDERGEVYIEYGVYAVPESFFLAPGLQARQKFLGALEDEPLRAMLDELGAPR